MATTKVIEVSKKGKPKIKANFVVPQNIEDPRWAELAPENTRDAINTLAVQQLIVKAQAAGRGEYDNGAAAVQKALDEYRYKAGRTGGARRAAAPKLSASTAKEGKFTAKQLEMLRAAGFNIESEESEEEAA